MKIQNLYSRIRAKLGSKSGESISETMVSVLISALALVMLAGAISTASHVIRIAALAGVCVELE